MVLQEALKVMNNVSGRTLLDGLSNVAVCSNDITELVGQIIFVSETCAGTVHRNGRTNWRRGHRQDGDNHPFGASLRNVDADVDHVRLGHVVQDSEGHLGGDDLLLLGLDALLILGIELGVEGEGLLTDGRVVVATAAVAGKLALAVGKRVELVIVALLHDLVVTSPLLLAHGPYAVKADLGIADLHGGRELFVILQKEVSVRKSKLPGRIGCTNSVSKNLAAVVADNLQNLLDTLDEAWVVDGSGQLDVTEMAGALGHVLGTRLALELAIYGAQEGVVETAVAGFRPGLVHGLWVDDVGHTHALDFLGRQQTELDFLDGPQGRTRVRKV